jgi:coenzyme F420-reducing hydrogenase delta subunit
MPCVARLKPAEVLQLFRQGWQTVEFRACSSEQCKYGAAWKNIQTIVDCVRNVLSRVRPEAGIELYLPPRAPEGQSPQETQDDRREAKGN